MHTDNPHKPRFQLWAALIAGMIALPASAADVDYAPLVPYEARYTASMSKGVSLNGEGVRELTDQGLARPWVSGPMGTVVPWTPWAREPVGP